MSSAACFGDNAGGEGGPADPDEPSITEIVGPLELLTDEQVDFTISVKGAANQELTVAIDTTHGSFSPQSQVVITDEAGQGACVSRFSSGGTGGTATITATISTPTVTGSTATRSVTLTEVERLGNVTSLNLPVVETANFLIAYPFELIGARSLLKFGIVAPEATTAHIGLYTSTTVGTPEPLALITKLTAPLTAGRNEITVPTSLLAAADYWMVVTYQGTPMVHKDAANPVPGWSLPNYQFARGLPDSFPSFFFNPATLSGRNFYLVLRR